MKLILKGLSGGDNHSYFMPIILADTASMNPNSYKPTFGNGINEGTILRLFNDDYFNTPRPQNGIWDMGAIEDK